jgi:hypothetical protein
LELRGWFLQSASKPQFQKRHAYPSRADLLAIEVGDRAPPSEADFLLPGGGEEVGLRGVFLLFALP